jgi:hypothetical protein
MRSCGWTTSRATIVVMKPFLQNPRYCDLRFGAGHDDLLRRTMMPLDTRQQIGDRID